MKELKTYYRRHLPHYQPLGYTYFVTFRLSGSLPWNVIQKLKNEYEAYLKKLSAVKDEMEKSKAYYDYHKYYFEKFDKFLNKYKDDNHWLGQNEVAAIVKEAIHFRDGKEYDLIAYTIMPNHVHIVFTPLVNRDSSRQKTQEVKAVNSSDINAAKQITPLVNRDLSRQKTQEAKAVNSNDINVARQITPLVNRDLSRQETQEAKAVNSNDINVARQITPLVNRDLSQQKTQEAKAVNSSGINVAKQITPLVNRDLSRQETQEAKAVSSSDINAAKQIDEPIVTKILRKLKGATARECNKQLNRSGDFWQHESYDHVIRNEEELDRIVEYVLNNPLKAGLTDSWEDWKWSYCKYL